MPWWYHKSATIFRLLRQCMGLMTSQLCIFRARSILLAFVVPKLILIFAAEGWLTQPYSILTLQPRSLYKVKVKTAIQAISKTRHDHERKGRKSDKNPSFGEKSWQRFTIEANEKEKLVAGEAHASDRLLPSSSISASSSSSSSSILIYIISIKTEWGEKVESSDKILNNQLVTIALPLFFGDCKNARIVFHFISLHFWPSAAGPVVIIEKRRKFAVRSFRGSVLQVRLIWSISLSQEGGTSSGLGLKAPTNIWASTFS